MFCKKCGTAIKEGDLFCGNCGTPVNGEMNHAIPNYNGGNHANLSLGDLNVVKFIKLYIRKPITFFSNMNNLDIMKVAISFLIGLPIISGLLNILYNSCLLNALYGMIKKIPEYLSEFGFISPGEVATMQKQMLMSSDFNGLKTKIEALVDNKDIFFAGFGQMLGLIVVTFVVVIILNAVILKGKMEYKNILLVSATSYIPLVIGMFLGSIVTFLSILFGAFIVLSGYILSFITLYNGIREISSEGEDKVFLLVALIFVILSAILAFYINKEIQNSIMSITKIYKTVSNFI